MKSQAKKINEINSLVRKLDTLNKFLIENGVSKFKVNRVNKLISKQRKNIHSLSNGQ